MRVNFWHDTVLPASFDESMIVSSFKFFAVIRISIVDPIRTLGNDRVYKKASGADLGFMRKNIGIQLPWEIIDGHKKGIREVYWQIAFQ